MRFGLGAYQLDDDQRVLTGPDGVVHVEPQVFNVLRYLVLNRHRAVAKDELLDELWGGRFVSESTLTSRIKAARRALGDDGQRQSYIQTLHGVGYRYIGEVTVALAEPSPLVTSSHRRLPVLRTHLIGRDDALVALVELTRQARFVTVVGPGGVGKTTLSLAAAHELQSSWSEGAIFIDLTAAATADDVTRAISTAAGIEGGASRAVDDLASNLAGRRVLLVLDNCEHVLGAVGDAVARLLSCGHEAHVLATSREPVGLHDEHVFPLEPLDDAAPELFVARARQIEPRVEWDAAAPEIVELCRRLDGLPLALELAAGQLRRWDLTELRDRLESRLASNGAGARQSGRHRTMADAIDWSYQLLDPREQRLLRHLSVFPTWFDRRLLDSMAELLPGVPLRDTLAELVDKSLVVRDPRANRYRLLETIRAFATEHLVSEGEADQARECHRAHIASLARQSSRLDRWLSASLAAQQRADLDHERDAFWRSVETNRLDDAVEIAVASAFLWRNAISCTEGARWLDALADAPLVPRDRQWVHILRADLAQGVGDFITMVLAAAAAREHDDGSDPAARCIAAHYEAMAHLTDPVAGHQQFSEVQHLAPDERLANLIRAFLLVAELGRSDRDGVLERFEHLHHVASDDGYERFILNWSGWMHALEREDGDAARRWIGRQHDYLERSGIVETWITSYSTALSESVEGDDISGLLSHAYAIAFDEGYRVEGDILLAFAYSEARKGNGIAAAELLGSAKTAGFNATAHFVLYRLVVDPVVRRSVSPEDYRRCLDAGSGKPVSMVLRERGLERTTTP